MCESDPTPLVQLSEQCAACLRHLADARQTPKSRGRRGCEPCRELAYRALCNGNDAAWDSLLVHLWPYILRAVYASRPELRPALAESLGYRVLWSLRDACAQRTDLATNFPTFPALLARLDQALHEVVATARGAPAEK